MVKNTLLSAGLIAAAGALAGASASNASSVSISNLASSPYAAGAYQATITFNVSRVGNPGSGSYSLAITLDNTSDMKSNTNLLKGVEFTLSSGTVDTSVADIGLTGSYATVQSNSPGYGTETALTSDAALNAVKANANWVANAVTSPSSTYQFYGNQGDMLVASSPQTTGSPYPDANPGFFTSANSTVLVNSPMFTLEVKNAVGLPVITLDEVYFGTSGGPGDLGVPVTTLIPVPTGGPLPIPATLPLVGGGLLGLGLIALRQRRQMRMR